MSILSLKITQNALNIKTKLTLCLIFIIGIFLIRVFSSVVCFSIIRFYFSFYIFFILFRSTVKFLFDTTFNYFRNFIVQLENSNNSTSFIKKDIYLISSKSLLYALSFGRNMHKGLIF